MAYFKNLAKSQQRNKQSHKQNDKPRRVPAIEGLYRKTRARMRNLRTTMETKELQIEIANEINTIETYGFRWFPNHYIFDNVNRLAKLVDELELHPSTNRK